MPTLQEIKDYLGVDGGHNDPLLLSQIETARELVESVLRFQIAKIQPLPHLVKEAIKFAVAYIFTHREQADLSFLDKSLRTMLNSLRREVF
ncbi:MAG: head-tail connector protein [Firmicutes bacterium]|nr:head-tail connector protein [Bacillota bacterium]